VGEKILGFVMMDNGSSTAFLLRPSLNLLARSNSY